jgi:hypothetical protein
MKSQPCFREYNPDQLMLFPTDLKQWLPEDELIYFLIDKSFEKLDRFTIIAFGRHFLDQGGA